MADTFLNRGTTAGWASQAEFDEGLRRHMLQVYNYMMLGLVVTGIVAYVVGTTPALYVPIFTTPLIGTLTEGGGLGTGRVSLFAGGRTRGWRYSGSGEWFNIDGYIPVATEQDPGIAPRGPVDSLLGSTHLSGYASAGYQAANGWRADRAA